jgi:HlyD family secretion protein
VATIDLGATTGAVTAEGRVVPLTETHLSFPAGGEIVEILVAEGDTVAAGDRLIRLDATDQEIAVEQATANVMQAEANIETAEAGLLAAQAGATAAEVNRDVAQAQLALLEAGASAEQIALGEQHVAVAEAGVIQAAANRDAALEAASQATIAAAEAQVAAAQATYNAAVRTYQPVTQNQDVDAAVREQAQLQINAALATLNAAQAALNNLQTGPTSAEQVAANSAVGVAANQREAAEANLALMLAGTRAERIAVAQSAITQAEDHLAEAEIRVDNAETAVSQAEAALVEANAGLATAESALERRTLTAPFAATVVTIMQKEHEVASAGAALITLADLSEWRIETTDLTEADVVQVAPDLAVEITLDAFPGERLAGRVTHVASVSDTTRGDVTYEMVVELDDDGRLPLRWGMSAFVTIETE